MFQKVVILSLLVTFLSANTFANNPADIVSDTTGDKLDSLTQPTISLPDPKEEFKGLFIKTTNEDGVTMDELNPLAISFVEDYMEKFGKKMEDMKANSKPYFDMMDLVLTKHGLPKELKYLAVIESSLKSNARSYAGAVGAWQFMPTTARNMGLQVNYKVDERRDLYKSTHAASRYLTSLYSLYGDWLLVIAAYNGGPGAVNSAIRRSGSRDFWKLQGFLPLESRNHVKKFIATHYIMEGEGGITTLTKMEANNRLAADSSNYVPDLTAKLQAITGRYNALVITRHIEMGLADFHKLNPDFDRQIASDGQYPLRLPDEKMDIFLARKQEILTESMKLLLTP